MNEEPTRIGEAELRMALRGLRQDIEPGSDLWPGIAARLQAPPKRSAQATSRLRHGWLWPLATAAALVMAIGLAWQFKPSTPAAATGGNLVAQSTSSDRGTTLVQREANGMTAHYQAALRELASKPVDAGWQPGLDALDRGAIEIRTALKHDPNSRLLLQRLRDTYTRRLALSRRAIYA